MQWNIYNVKFLHKIFPKRDNYYTILQSSQTNRLTLHAEIFAAGMRRLTAVFSHKRVICSSGLAWK